MYLPGVLMFRRHRTMPFLDIDCWSNFVLTIKDRHAILETYIFGIHSDMMIHLLANAYDRMMMTGSAASLKNVLLVFSDGNQIFHVISYTSVRQFSDR